MFKIFLLFSIIFNLCTAEAYLTPLTQVIPVTSGGTGTTTQFTQGSVVVAGASGVYTQDNANFFYDPVGHYLGLGNAAPASQLDIFTSALVPINLNSAGKYAIAFQLGGVTKMYFAMAAATDDWDPGSVAGDITWRLQHQSLLVSSDGGNTTAFKFGQTTNYSYNPLAIATSIAQPTCAVGIRGALYVLQGASTVHDQLLICMKKADDTYAWVSIVTAP